ncbi:MAG: hypothetical protein ACRC4W_07710 [Treponemataceae bacterium]
MTSGEHSKDAWYSYAGKKNDIVISSRIRFARNLANFPFPLRIKNADEGSRIQSLVFDAFSKMENPDFYQALSTSNLDKLGQDILIERGVLAPKQKDLQWIGVVVRLDGKLSCTINSIDHVRLSAFAAGLNFESILTELKTIDNKMQDMLQFAASNEFGYLTANHRDLGSGMKISAILHLPAITHMQLMDQLFSKLQQEDHCKIDPFFDKREHSQRDFSNYYLLSNTNSFSGTEQDQCAALQEVIEHLCAVERGASANIMETNQTKLKDIVLRSIALLKFNRFIEYREGVDLISKIKWGVNAGLVRGVNHTTLTELLFRTQNAHLAFVIKTGGFNFPLDITDEAEKILRLRSLILQESLEKIEFFEG